MLTKEIFIHQSLGEEEKNILRSMIGKEITLISGGFSNKFSTGDVDFITGEGVIINLETKSDLLNVHFQNLCYYENIYSELSFLKIEESVNSDKKFETIVRLSDFNLESIEVFGITHKTNFSQKTVESIYDKSIIKFEMIVINSFSEDCLLLKSKNGEKLFFSSDEKNLQLFVNSKSINKKLEQCYNLEDNSKPEKVLKYRYTIK